AVLEELADELALTPAEVDDAAGADGFQGACYGLEALIVEGAWFLEGLLFFVCLSRFGFQDIIGLEQAGKGFAPQVTAVLKVAVDDLVFRRVGGEPVGAVAEELFDLGFGDPVVLLVIEDGDEDVKM